MPFGQTQTSVPGPSPITPQNNLLSFMPLALIFVLFCFLLILYQHQNQKKQQAVKQKSNALRFTTFRFIFLILLGCGMVGIGAWAFSTGNTLFGVICFGFGLWQATWTSQKFYGAKLYEGICPYCNAELTLVKTPADTCACCKKPFLVRDDGFYKMD